VEQDVKEPYAYLRCQGDVLTDDPTPEYSCGLVGLTELEYVRQCNRPTTAWECPRCGSTAFPKDESDGERHNARSAA
jgi:hypothetical protein